MTTTPVFRPCLVFLPYLPLEDVVLFDKWELGPVAAFDGRWTDRRFEELSKRFIRSFKDRAGAEIKGSSILASKADGVTGERPTPGESVALQAALDFAFLDLCPKDQRASNAMLSLWTSDNTELFQWPIDITEGYVSFQYGGVAVTWDGGYRIQEDLVIPAPIELFVPLHPGSPDERLLEAIYAIVLSSTTAPRRHPSRQVATAISWLSKAWKNTKSITVPDRIVYLKTGFEALMDESSVWGGAEAVRRLHERVLANESLDRTQGLLWSNTETERFSWPDGEGVDRSVTDLQLWMKVFGSARNDIIHGGVSPSFIFEHHTAYDGHLFFIGQQLLRESIKLVATELGYQDLWRDQVDVSRDELVAEIFQVGGRPIASALSVKDDS